MSDDGLIKCRHCGFVIRKPRRQFAIAQYVTCSRCEGRRSVREGQVLRADRVKDGFSLGERGDYRAEVRDVNHRTRMARIEIETERGLATARVPIDKLR